MQEVIVTCQRVSTQRDTYFKGEDVSWNVDADHSAVTIVVKDKEGKFVRAAWLKNVISIVKEFDSQDDS